MEKELKISRDIEAKHLELVQLIHEISVKPVKDTSEGIVDYVRTLEKCGFSTPVVKEVNSLTDMQVSKRDKSGRIVDAYNCNNVRFPGMKILTFSDILKICEKYDLYCGRRKSYIGEIPEKNLLELSRFLEKHTVMEPIPLISDEIGIIASRNMFYLESHDKLIGKTIVCDDRFKIKDKPSTRSIVRSIIKIFNDPIIIGGVSLPIPGGAVVIISKWGKEAEYPEFLNELEN